MNKNYILLNNKVNMKDKEGNYINLELDKQAVKEYFLNNINQNTVFFHSLEEKLDYLVENGYYDKKVLDKYTIEEIKEVFKLAYSKKFRFRSYLGAFMFYDRYALRTTDKERILERYEDRLSMIALTIGRNVKEAKEFLNILINRQLQPATPIYMNSGKLKAGNLVSCFDGNERVMTDNGYIKIKDIKIGDKVLTHTGNYEKVYELIKNDYDDYFVDLTFNCTFNNLKATKEHPIYALKKEDIKCIRYMNTICLNNNRKNCIKREKNYRNDCIYHNKGIKGKLNWYNIDELNIGDYVAISYDNKDYKRIVYDMVDFLDEDYEYNYNEDVVYRKTLDKKTNNKKGNDIHQHYTPIKRFIEQSNELGRFVGYFLSEGYIIKDKRAEDKIRGVVFTINKNDLYIINDIINIIKNIFNINEEHIKINENNKDNTKKINIRNGIIGKFIYSLCGTYFNKKKLRKDLMLSNKEFQKHILIGTIRGDGCAIENGYILQLSNKTLIEQLQLLGFRNNLLSNYSFIEVENYENAYSLKFNVNKENKDFFFEVNKNVNKIDINKNTLKTVFNIIYDGYILYRIKNKKYEYSKQKVYNLEVENDHSYTVNNFIVHNCFILNLEDNLESISYVNHSAMKLSQMGAGIGLDMTNIRARGDSIKGIENMAGGILPPSKVLEDIFSYINQLGKKSA